jgi:hypothetical protein
LRARAPVLGEEARAGGRRVGDADLSGAAREGAAGGEEACVVPSNAAVRRPVDTAVPVGTRIERRIDETAGVDGADAIGRCIVPGNGGEAAAARGEERDRDHGEGGMGRAHAATRKRRVDAPMRAPRVSTCADGGARVAGAELRGYRQLSGSPTYVVPSAVSVPSGFMSTEDAMALELNHE